MNIKKHLQAGHSKTITTAIVNYIGHDKARFKELMNVFLQEDYRLTQRAAWPLSYVCIANPQLVKPYFPQLISKLGAPEQHAAIRRNILRMFREIEIPEKYQAQVIDACFKIIPDPANPAAIVAFAIYTATRLCKPFTELRGELRLVLDELVQQPQKPAVKATIKKAIKELT